MNKKILTVCVLICACMIMMTGCGSGPEEVVSEFCDSMKEFDYAKMNACMAESSEELLEDGEMDAFSDFIKEKAKSMNYKIKDTAKNDEDALVTVVFDYFDASPIMENLLAEYLTQAITLAFSGASDEEIEQLMYDIFDEQVEKITLNKTRRIIQINCIKVNDEWKIEEVNDEMLNVLTCNIAETFKELENSLGSLNGMSNLVEE